MKNIVIVGIALSMVLAGCARVQLRAEAAEVQFVSAAYVAAQGCKYLDKVATVAASVEGGLAGAQTKARNAVVERGGNSILISSQTTEGRGDGYLLGDVYLCKRGP